jgi:hypothetical protein
LTPFVPAAPTAETAALDTPAGTAQVVQPAVVNVVVVLAPAGLDPRITRKPVAKKIAPASGTNRFLQDLVNMPPPLSLAQKNCMEPMPGFDAPDTVFVSVRDPVDRRTP